MVESADHETRSREENSGWIRADRRRDNRPGGLRRVSRASAGGRRGSRRQVPGARRRGGGRTGRLDASSCHRHRVRERRTGEIVVELPGPHRAQSDSRQVLQYDRHDSRGRLTRQDEQRLEPEPTGRSSAPRAGDWCPATRARFVRDGARRPIRFRPTTDCAVRVGTMRHARSLTALGQGFHADDHALRRAVRQRSSVNLFHRATSTKVDLFIAGSWKRGLPRNLSSGSSGVGARH